MKRWAPVGWTIAARVMSNVAVKFTLAKLRFLCDFFQPKNSQIKTLDII